MLLELKEFVAEATKKHQFITGVIRVWVSAIPGMVLAMLVPLVMR